MERWRNKVAVVTGASNAIGSVCSLDLVKAGMIVAAFVEKEVPLKSKLPEELKDKLHIINCNVSKEDEVVKSFKWVLQNLGAVHILVNFALFLDPRDLCGLYSTPTVQKTVDINILGIAFCVREAFNQMKEFEIDGHIVLLNSIAGHRIPKTPIIGSFNIAPATKFATTAMTETYRQEFSKAGTNVKITVGF